MAAAAAEDGIPNRPHHRLHAHGGGSHPVFQSQRARHDPALRPVAKASADWGRWPAGTIFRIIPTGENFIVDDYGWAIAGTNTIDLYKPTRADMNAWGVRRVDIQVLQWGDPRASYRTLEPRSRHAHVKRMLKELRPQI